MYEYSCREDVTRYLRWSPHPSESYTYKYLTYLQSRYRAGDFYDWAVTLSESGKMIGTCGFSSFDLDNDTAEVGYVLSPDHWHKGIAAEALRKVMGFGFEELSLHRIYARIMEGNEASERVAEKCGMRHEATLKSSLLVKGEYRTIKIYAILREEFEK